MRNADIIAIIISALLITSLLVYVARSNDAKLAELDRLRAAQTELTKKAKQYVWAVHCVDLYGQLDTVVVATYSPEAHIALLNVNDEHYLVTIEADERLTYIKPDIIEITNSVLIR